MVKTRCDSKKMTPETIMSNTEATTRKVLKYSHMLCCIWYACTKAFRAVRDFQSIFFAIQNEVYGALRVWKTDTNHRKRTTFANCISRDHAERRSHLQITLQKNRNTHRAGCCSTWFADGCSSTYRPQRSPPPPLLGTRGRVLIQPWYELLFLQFPEQEYQ